MVKQKSTREAKTGKFVGVSTSADVKAFRAANAANAARVMATKDSARAYIRKLEEKIGVAAPKKK